MNIGMSGKRGSARSACGAVLLAVLGVTSLAGCVSNVPAAQEATPGIDQAITAGVREALEHSPQLTVADIDVNTSQGIVRLSGFVASADSVGVAASVARSVKGVRSVRNDLRLK